MNVIKRTTTAMLSFIAMFSLAIPAQAYASTNSTDSINSIQACDSLGKHKGIENKRRVFIPAAGEPAYTVGPHQSFSYTLSKSVTVKGSLSFTADASFWGIAKVELSGTAEMSKTASSSATWTVNNSSNSTKFYRLGSYGYEFDYVNYEVVAPCRIVNMQRKHGKLPTDTIGLVEVRS